MRSAEGAPGPLRVLLTVHHDLVRGAGAPGSTLALADALEARGHVVEVMGLGLLRRAKGATAEALAFPHAVARVVRRRLERGDLDIVDASTGDLAYVARRHVRAASVAVFTRSHGLEPLAVAARRAGAAAGELELRRRYGLYHAGLRLREVRASLRAADGVLLLNDAEVTFATTQLRVPAERVWRTSPLGADRLVLRDREEHRDVLVLGDASWRKGGDVALRTLEAVLRARPEATASWAGLSDPEQVRRDVGADVAERVTLCGRYDDEELAELLASHRVLIFASRFEGLPVTLLEALGSGIAVVGSDVPGVRDLLESGAGRLVAPGHVEGFAAEVGALVTDDAARAQCARRATEVAANYATSLVVDRLVAAYRDVLGVKRPAG